MTKEVKFDIRLLLLGLVLVGVIIWFASLAGKKPPSGQAVTKPTTQQSNPSETADKLLKEWDEQTREAITKHKVLIGMTAEQVRASLGAPDHINRSVRMNEVTEQWVYGHNYLHFYGGVVNGHQFLVLDSVQTSR
jgi:hypothetical protein